MKTGFWSLIGFGLIGLFVIKKLTQAASTKIVLYDWAFNKIDAIHSGMENFRVRIEMTNHRDVLVRMGVACRLQVGGILVYPGTGSGDLSGYTEYDMGAKEIRDGANAPRWDYNPGWFGQTAIISPVIIDATLTDTATGKVLATDHREFVLQ